MNKILLIGLLAVCILAGCTSVRDGRGASEVCEVHHAFMRSVELPGPKGSNPLPPEYVAAGIRQFPHCYPDYVPDTRHRIVLYICGDCVNAQKAWKQAHPGVVP